MAAHLGRRKTLVKKLVIIGAGCVMGVFSLVACGGNEESQHAKEYTGICSAEIRDAVDEQYKEPLHDELSSEEVGDLIQLLEGENLSPGENGSKRFYRIVFYDKDGESYDELTVNTNREISLPSGKTVKGDSLDAWLRQMESSHGISYESVFDRQLGDRFFALLGDVEYGTLREITETNFDKGIDCDIPHDMIENLRKTSDSVKTVLGEREDPTTQYTLSLYDANSAELYTLSVGKNGGVYCNGYEVVDESLVSWVLEVVADQMPVEQDK